VPESLRKFLETYCRDEKISIEKETTVVVTHGNGEVAVDVTKSETMN